MESFLENLRQEAHCHLCNHTLTEPKLLQCCHAFCKPCIQRHAQLKEQVHIFKCPQCSSETLFQELSNVEDLQPSPLHSRMLQVLAFSESEKSCSVSETHSLALWHCLDCDCPFCDECLKCHSTITKDHKVISLSDVKKEDLESMLRKENPCKTHFNSNLEIFCKDCDVLMCLLCLKDDHKDHKTSPLQDVTAIKKDSLSKTFEEIERLRYDEMEKKQQEEMAIHIKSNAAKAKEEVKTTTKKLMKRLVNKEQQLLDHIQRSVTKADRNLRVIRHIPAAQDYIKNIIAHGVVSDLVDGCKEFRYDPYKPDIAGIVFSPDEDNDVKLGNVRLSRKSNPVFSKIEVDSDLKALGKGKLSVVTKTSTGDLNYDDCDVVDIQINPTEYVKVEEKTMKTDGKIEVEFMPRVSGKLTAEVRLNGIPVSNSSLVMNVEPQHLINTLRDHSKLRTALNTGSQDFMGIAVNKTNSRIAVADCAVDCVRVFNMDGELLLVYGCKGREQEQLQNPRGLAFLSDVDLVVVDGNNHRISMVNTTTGKLVKTFGCQGNGNGEFSNPRGVHVDDDGNIIVTDSGNRRVQVFTKDGDYQYQFTVPNQGNFHPHSTVTHNGLFYVSDQYNGMIHVIQTKDGSTIRLSTIGETDDGVGHLQTPCGLVIDDDGNLLVCDVTSQLVNKYTLDGRVIGKTSTLNHSPSYIEVLNDGLFICTFESEVAIFGGKDCIDSSFGLFGGQQEVFGFGGNSSQDSGSLCPPWKRAFKISPLSKSSKNVNLFSQGLQLQMPNNMPNNLALPLKYA